MKINNSWWLKICFAAMCGCAMEACRRRGKSPALAECLRGSYM